MTKKIFALADVLSVSTGVTLPNDENHSPLDAVYGVMNHVTGSSLMTHQLPAFFDEVAESLMRQHPFLESIELPKRGEKDSNDEYVALLRSWVKSKERVHGKTLEIEQDPSFGSISPLDGLPEGKKIIPVVINE